LACELGGGTEGNCERVGAVLLSGCLYNASNKKRDGGEELFHDSELLNALRKFGK